MVKIILKHQIKIKDKKKSKTNETYFILDVGGYNVAFFEKQITKHGRYRLNSDKTYITFKMDHRVFSKIVNGAMVKRGLKAKDNLYVSKMQTYVHNKNPKNKLKFPNTTPQKLLMYRYDDKCPRCKEGWLQPFGYYTLKCNNCNKMVSYKPDNQVCHHCGGKFDLNNRGHIDKRFLKPYCSVTCERLENKKRLHCYNCGTIITKGGTTAVETGKPYCSDKCASIHVNKVYKDPMRR